MKAKAIIEVEVDLSNEPRDKGMDLSDIAANVCGTVAEYGVKGLNENRRAKLISVRCQYLESFKIED